MYVEKVLILLAREHCRVWQTQLSMINSKSRQGAVPTYMYMYWRKRVQSLKTEEYNDTEKGVIRS